MKRRVEEYPITEDEAESCDTEVLDNITDDERDAANRHLALGPTSADDSFHVRFAESLPASPTDPVPRLRDPDSPRSPTPPPPLQQPPPPPRPRRKVKEDEIDYSLSAKELTEQMLERNGEQYAGYPVELREGLNFCNTMKLQLRESSSTSARTKSIMIGILGGAAIKQNRMLTEVSRHLQINPDRLRGISQVTSELKKRTRNKAWKDRITGVVSNFYCNDDVSRQNPGKKDRIVDRENPLEKRYVQTRVLNDYMEISWEKFKSEFPDEKIGRSLFYNLRPKHVLTSSHLQGFSCLCKIHENMGLVLKGARPFFEEHFPLNPDAFLRKIDSVEACDEMLENGVYAAVEETDDIAFRQWKGVTDTQISKKTGKEIKVTKTKCKPVVMSFANFKKEFRTQFGKFQEHSERIFTQYREIKKLKETLKIGELLIYMDFSENYLIKAADRAVQGSYWNTEFVTLHPICVYWRGEDGELHHQSFCYVSGIMNHNIAFVISCIKSLLMVDIKKKIGDIPITRVTYISDSPSSQYRNRYQALFLSIHREIFGIDVLHIYFEVGHGKSVCDGIAGSLKRRADEAVYQGRVNITNVEEFFAYAELFEKSINPVFITKEQYLTTFSDVKLWDDFTTSVAGNNTLHCIVPQDVGIVAHNLVACGCDPCRDNLDVRHCTKYTWKIQDIRKAKELPSKRQVPFHPQSVTACTNTEDPCEILCMCEYKDNIDHVPIASSFSTDELDMLDAIGEDEETAYVGAVALDADKTTQDG